MLNKDRKDKLTNITFNRHLESLIKLGELEKFKYPEYEKLGLFPKQKNSSYITSSQIASNIKHYDEVFSLLKDKNSLKRKNALIEIESMGGEKIILSPAQLNFLVNLLNKEEYKLCENIIRIIYNSIDNNKIFPSKLENFQKELINFVEKYYRKGLSDNAQASVIYILGLLDNPFVLKFLKEEIKGYHEDFDTLVRKGYGSWAISKMIEDSKTELLKFQYLTTIP